MIIFNEEQHVYTHLESGNTLNGWTSLIKNYTEPFNTDLQKVASAYAMFLGKEYNSIKFFKKKNAKLDELVEYLEKNYPGLPHNYIDELTFEWNYSNILGSNFHRKLEEMSYSRGYEINPFTDRKHNTITLKKEYDNQSAMPNLFFLEDGYYPELLVWDYSMGESNTPVTMIDKCFIETIDGIRYVDVDDIKTNKAIYSDKGKMMKGVLSSIPDNVEEKYKMQACFGAKLLSTFGFTPRYCGFTHFKEYNESKAKLYLAKYDEDLMDKFQEDWKRIYKERESSVAIV